MTSIRDKDKIYIKLTKDNLDEKILDWAAKKNIEHILCYNPMFLSTHDIKQKAWDNSLLIEIYTDSTNTYKVEYKSKMI